MADWHDRSVRGEIPGRVGGLSTSRAKAAAARENGKLGGRPKNKTKLRLAEERATLAEARATQAEIRAAELERRIAELEAARRPPAPGAPAPRAVDRFGLIELD